MRTIFISQKWQKRAEKMELIFGGYQLRIIIVKLRMCFLIKLFRLHQRHDNFNYMRFSRNIICEKSNILIRLISFSRAPPRCFQSEAEAFVKQIFEVFPFLSLALSLLFNCFRNNINQTFKLINSERLINYN